MRPGRASRTALRVAHRRAVHQLLDQPCVFSDSIAVPILGPGFAIDRDREMGRTARAFRAFMAVRSRYAEDRLAEAVARGATQYVVLGAGLDTFAYRNPHSQLRVFEVDFPATQVWKRELLEKAGIAAPASLTYLPLDFEHCTLAEGLAGSGFDCGSPAFFAWLGVVPYLTADAFRATLAMIGSLPSGTGVSFDYGLSPTSFGPMRRAAFEALAGRVAAAGEPFHLLFIPEELEAELRAAGFNRAEQLDSDALNDIYFKARDDDFKLPSPGLAVLATGWV